ncbi:MAG: conjugal transfer protein TraH [Betaproteobacteria bacterium AqS2]|uniref:Conjugal transfer protein TraH n=1 Tax=Candidatus Amphirhobacter heronislandensis TaxID=1732024 RepID=A0A930XWG0_9GAMM|nr:conjugal transfer protein TraH [Betaproteobacteria bacterium AqS2]
MKTLRLALVLALSAAGAGADVARDMRAMFDGIGAYGSVDGPRHIAAQSRHVFSGGGLQYRAPRRSYSLYNVTAPSLQAGCGGIDLYAGSFSFINKDRFVQMLKNIAGNSVGLAFKTALCSTSANLCQAVEDVQRTVEQLNRFNIDSCEAAKRLVGGAFGAAEQSSQSACMAAARQGGQAADAAAARQLCAQPSGYAQIRRAAAKSPAAAAPVDFVGGNMTWEVLSKSAAGLDKQDREFLMSMLGAHVVMTTSVALRYHLADLNQRQVVMLRCGDKDCLQVARATVTLSTSFLDLSRRRLEDIRGAVRQGRALSSVQLNLVASSPLPLLAMIQADEAGAAGLLDVAAEAVAYASAHHHLAASLRGAAGLAAGWRSRSAAEDELLREMVADTRRLRAELAAEMHASLQRVNAMLEASGRLRDLRRGIATDRFVPLLGP